MIFLTVEGQNGMRSRCRTDLSPQGDAKWFCGLCSGGQLAPWIGFKCTNCRAIVIVVEAQNRDVADGLEQWLFDAMKKSASKNETSAPATQARNDVLSRLADLVNNFNARQRS